MIFRSSAIALSYFFFSTNFCAAACTFSRSIATDALNSWSWSD